MQEIVINKLIVKKVNFVRWGSGVLKVL